MLGPRAAGGFVTRAVLFLLVSVLSGALTAGFALPLVGTAGVAARGAADGFQALPSELKTPPLPQRSRILAADGSLLATFYYQNRVSVPLTAVAPVMRQAIVAIEDSRFYEHGGADLRGILRAALNNSSGEDRQGASTLTQQYVKNVLIQAAQEIQDPEERAEAVKSATEQSYGRKIRELRYAVAIEEQYGKNEILQRYLNISYFGRGAYGIEAAARTYFSTTASRLTLTQATLLAGLVQKPIGYDPTRNPKAALERRNTVINRMEELGYLSPELAASARRTPIKLRVSKSSGNGCELSYAPFFCDYVLNVIKNDKAFGRTARDRIALLLGGGLTITTTLDRTKQVAAQKAVREYVEPTNKVASALASVEPESGAIRAMAISRLWGTGTGRTKVNYATDYAYGGSRGFQAGSTFKVFVAAAALEKGIPFSYRIRAPYQKVIGDVESCNGTLTDPWDPVNESESENGTFDLRTATALSVNTYFAQLEERTGVCRPFTLANAMGVQRADGKPLAQVKSFTLGVNEVSPLAMAEAYASFAARGLHCPAVAITRVVDSAGKPLAVPRPQCQQVMDAKIADGMNALLRGVIDSNIRSRTGARVSLGRPAAGKTGTTNGRVSVWFVGYTPDLATAVWAGNPTPPRGGYKLIGRTIGGRYYDNVCGGCLPGPIWRQYMREALASTPATPFEPAPFDVVAGDASRLPDVSGMSPSSAKARLESLGYEVVVSRRRVDSGQPEGTVAYTDPGAGARVFPGETVYIRVSDGTPRAPRTTPPPSTPPPAPTPTATSTKGPRDLIKQFCKKYPERCKPR